VDSATVAWHDQEDARIAATIRASGWAVTYVGGESCSRPGCVCPPGDGPPFAYTVGLFGLGNPELLVFGVDPGTASGLLNNLGARVKSGEHRPGDLSDLDGFSGSPGRQETWESQVLILEGDRACDLWCLFDVSGSDGQVNAVGSAMA
jgi:hypothetical protein